MYADELRDLLRLSDTPRSGNVVIQESPSRGTYVDNAEWAPYSLQCLDSRALLHVDACTAAANWLLLNPASQDDARG